MKKQVWMDPKTTYILIALLLLVPAILLVMPGASGSYYNPHEDIERLYSWICHYSYLVFPSILTYCFVKSQERVSWVLSVEFAVAGIVYALLLKEETDIWLFAKGAIMMAILSHYPMFQRLTKDWKYLTLVYMWSGLYYFAIQWLFPGTSPGLVIIMLAFGGVLAIAMGILPGFLKKPLDRNGWIGVALTMVITILLLTDCFMGLRWVVNLGVLLLAYAIMAVRLWGREYPNCAS